MRAWRFSSVILPGPGKLAAQRVEIGAEGLLDGDLQEVNTEVLRKPKRIIAALPGTELGRHEHADHVLAAERFHGNGRNQGGIDAAGQAYHRGLESGLLDIITRAEHERPVDLLTDRKGPAGLPCGDCLPFRRRPLGKDDAVDGFEMLCLRWADRGLPVRDHEIGDQEVFLELPSRYEQSAFSVDDHALTVEDQLILAAHSIGVGHDDVALSRPFSEHLEPFFALSFVVRRGIDVDNHLGACQGKGARGSFAEPDVLADVHAELYSPQGDEGIAVPGTEIAVLVEDTVVRQQDLVVHRCQAPVVEDCRCVVQPLLLVDKPDNSGDAPGRPLDVLERPQVVIHELRLEQQVLGGIAGHGELGEGHDVGPGLPGAADRFDDPVPVAGEVADRGVDLCHGNAKGSHKLARR